MVQEKRQTLFQKGLKAVLFIHLKPVYKYL